MANSGTRPVDNATARCLWCNALLPTGRRHGSVRRFCCQAHRLALWTAARRWVLKALSTGLLSVGDLKAAQRSEHASQEAFHDGR